MKKMLAILLTLAMLIGMLAGCGAEKENAQAEPNADVNTPTSESSDVEAAPVEDAPKYDTNAVLNWYFMGDEEEDNQMVFDKANEMIKEELGFTVNFIPIPASEYQDKISLAINGGDDWDICWTSNWRNNILQNVEREAFLPLDDLIAKHPDLVAAISPSLWEASKIGGVTYGITCQQNVARNFCPSIPTMYSDLYDEKTAGGITKYSDLTEYMAAVAAEYPGELTTGAVQDWNEIAFIWGWEQVLGAGYPAAIDMTAEGKIEVFNQYATEEFKDMVFTRYQWTQDGITLGGASNKEQSQWNPWEKPLEISTYSPGYLNDTTTSSMGHDRTQKPGSDAYVTFGSVAATMMGVNADTEYPEECVAFLAFLNTSPELMDLLTYGIEGEHYTRESDGKITRIQDSGYSKQSGWRVGNTFILSLTSTQIDTAITDTIAFNEAGIPSPIAGFTPDLSAIEMEMTNCRSVYEEYCMGLFDEGLSKDIEADWAAFQQKLEVAGVQKIIDELQAQLDVYLGQ